MSHISSFLRPDRLLTCFFVRPFLMRNGPVRRMPILMYHSVSWKQGNRFPYFETNTYPTVLEKHLRLLTEAGYKTIPLDDYTGCMHQPEGRYVSITFDDGYEDLYTHALPILKRYGARATVFLPTSFIGHPRKRFNSRPCLNWDEVMELSDNGVTFGSHSHSHPEMQRMCMNELEAELSVSKEIIESKTGLPVSTFSYPYAFPETNRFFLKRLIHCLKQTGYKIGVTTRIGINLPDRDMLCLKRIPVNSHDDLDLFSAKLDGAYNWVNRFQVAVKNLKGYHPNGRKPAGKIARG